MQKIHFCRKINDYANHYKHFLNLQHKYIQRQKYTALEQKSCRGNSPKNK